MVQNHKINESVMNESHQDFYIPASVKRIIPI